MKRVPFGYAMFAMASAIAALVWALDRFIVAPLWG